MKKLFILSALTLASLGSFSQGDWMSYPAGDSTKTNNGGETLDFNKGGGKVTLHEDKRMKGIEAFLRTGEEDVEGIKIDGYRVLIFFDSDKSMAEQRKAQFISAYPDVRTYVDFKAPNYRVRVGNFRTKLEAESLKSQLIMEYPTAIVVNDKIQLPLLDTEDSK